METKIGHLNEPYRWFWDTLTLRTTCLDQTCQLFTCIRITPKLVNTDSSAPPPETDSAVLGRGLRICTCDQFSSHVLLVRAPHSELDRTGNSENSSQKKQVLPDVFDLIHAILFHLGCPSISCHPASYLVFTTHFKNHPSFGDVPWKMGGPLLSLYFPRTVCTHQW